MGLPEPDDAALSGDDAPGAQPVIRWATNIASGKPTITAAPKAQISNFSLMVMSVSNAEVRPVCPGPRSPS